MSNLLFKSIQLNKPYASNHLRVAAWLLRPVHNGRPRADSQEKSKGKSKNSKMVDGIGNGK